MLFRSNCVMVSMMVSAVSRCGLHRISAALMPSLVALLGTICTSGGVRERPENGRFQPFFVLWLSVQIRADTGLIGNFHSILHGIEPLLGSGPIDLRRWL